MAHNVQTMFSVKETPWHGLGEVLVDAPTVADGIKLAGADWTVGVEPLYRADGVLVEQMQAFVRSDNKKTIGVVGPKTVPFQNVDAFNFFQPFIDAGEATLETGGVLGEGEKVWILAKINRQNSEIVRGDEIAKFVMLSNSHDGTTAVRVGFTPIRIVCANTLAMAHASKASKLLRVRHSKKVKEKVDDIQAIMKITDAEFEATADQYRKLACREINQNDLKKYVKVVFGMEDDDAKMATRTKNILERIVAIHGENVADYWLQERRRQRAEAIAAVEENMEAGRGTENEASRGSWWTAYNAVTEYLNYERGNTPETRLESLWFGANAKANDDALGIALTLSAE